MTRTESRRYYYTGERSFEQSLDVYKPILAQRVQKDEAETNPKNDPIHPLPLVVLVVGSAWLGHRSIIYAGTSWWNSSGPRAFAKQGCVTVCIRHRGSFPRIPGPSLSLALVCLVALLAGTYKFPGAWQGNDVLVSAVAAILIGWILLTIGARGAADFETMIHDVAEALCWVQRHKDGELLTTNNFAYEEEEKKDSSEGEPASKTTLVFGGYSSGGHVAATLLQRPELFAAKGLPPPDEFCDAAIFVSGVLAVRPPIARVTSTTTSTCSTTTTGTSSCSSNTSTRLDDSTTTCYQPSGSTWCTDLVTKVVFGTSGAAKLPSPLHGIHKQPNVPHLLIGCEHEVFGLTWMDVFFCSQAFCESLNYRKVPAKLVQVQSDHWNILGSKSLSNALSEELQWIMKQVLE